MPFPVENACLSELHLHFTVMKNFVLNGPSKVRFAKQANRVWQLSGGSLLFVVVLLYAGKINLNDRS